MPVGFFWYFRPNHDPIKQADYFCDLIRSRRWSLPPACDLEDSGGMQPYQVTAATKEFIYQVYHRLSVWPLLYTRAAWFNANTIAIELWLLIDLWIARYTSKPAPWGNPGDKSDMTPRDFRTWRFWQVSADGNGLGGEYGADSDSICIELFNGDEQAFCQYLGLTPSLLAKVKKPAAALRSGPGGSVIGTTWRGRTWPVLGRSGDGAWTRVEGWIKSTDVQDSTNH
jgi:hypothetical protein